MSLFHTATLNAWSKFWELGKRIESYDRVKQGKREHFSDSLQRLTKAVQIGVTDLEARWVLIKSMVFENANIEC